MDRSPEKSLIALTLLDLSAVKQKLMEPPPEGKAWTEEQADEAEKWYRRFLELGVRYPEVSIVPNYPIDTIWHQHILDTRAYARDCDDIFGRFLHHYPYFGLNGDAAERDRSFDTTDALYVQHFGESCTEMQFFGEEIEESTLYQVHPSIFGSRNLARTKSGCGDKGSGTGCRQGCGRR